MEAARSNMNKARLPSDVTGFHLKTQLTGSNKYYKQTAAY